MFVPGKCFRRVESGTREHWPPAVIVRPATRADVPALGRLGALLVRMYHELDPGRFIAATPRTERGYGSWLASQLDEPDVVLLVAERADEVVGYAYAGVEGTDYMAPRGPAGVIHDLVVAPSIGGEASVGCFWTARSTRSGSAGRHAPCCRPRRATRPRSACSSVPDSARRCSR